jgi:hypothetical protein
LGSNIRSPYRTRRNCGRPTPPPALSGISIDTGASWPSESAPARLGMALAGGADGSPSHATPQQMPENLLEANFGPCVSNARVVESVRNSSHISRARRAQAVRPCWPRTTNRPLASFWCGGTCGYSTSDAMAALTID